MASNPSRILPDPVCETPAPPSRARRGIGNWVLSHLSRETSSGRFIPEMDGLRFVSVATIIFVHLNGYLSVKSPAYYSFPETSWVNQVVPVGYRAVEMFFMISGFILGLPFAAHYIKDAPAVKLDKYYLRRLTRLEPPYMAAVLLLFLGAIYVQGQSARDLYPHLGASFVYLHNAIYGYFSPVIGVGWTLEIEVQFYLLVPWLTPLFAIRNRFARRSVFLALIITILALQSLFLHHDSPRASLSILAYIQFFLLGLLLADIFLTDWRESPQKNLYWDIVALAGWPIVPFLARSPALTHWLFPGLLLSLYCSTFRGRLVNRIFVYPWITAIGGMCYSIYLLHFEGISIVARFTKRLSEGAPYWIHLWFQFALVGVIVVLLCSPYFVFLEKPCMRRDWPQRLRSYLRSVISPRPQVVETETAD